jgi:hypothetical protein
VAKALAIVIREIVQAEHDDQSVPLAQLDDRPRDRIPAVGQEHPRA